METKKMARSIREPKIVLARNRHIIFFAFVRTDRFTVKMEALGKHHTFILCNEYLEMLSVAITCLRVNVTAFGSR